MTDTVTLVQQLNEFAKKQDFEGAFALVRANKENLEKNLKPIGVCDALRKTTMDRLLLSFLDSAGFATRSLDTALMSLEKLVSFRADALVLNDTWGLGRVRRIDYFYRRITVDFKTRRGHQFTYDAAVDMLESAPENHILVLRDRDPAAFDSLLKEKPADFIKAVLSSYGDMSVQKLEDVCVKNGFVKAVNWKKYWDAARGALRADKKVSVPTRRAEPIVLLAQAEDYGDSWLTAFSHETDPKLILAGVREYVAQGKFKLADETVREKIGDRLAFAVTAAKKVDDALFARLACTVTELGFAKPDAAAMRAYLWERKRFIKAAALLPSREVGAMIGFLADSEEAKTRLYAALPEFCFAAVSEVVSRFRDEKSVDVEHNPIRDENGHEVYPCRKAVGDFMRKADAPATLTTLLVGRIENFGKLVREDVVVDGKKIPTLKSFTLWRELPPLITLLTHAIALGEGRRGGETLKMQNIVRRLFGDRTWLEKMFKLLGNVSDQVLFFERFQASIAWDPSTHHTTVVRMAKLVPELEGHLVRVEKNREYARMTSYRSFAMRKAEYLKLINEDMPENVRKIEFAKGFGDLSENAEYQYAKDEQRQLMQKQTLMQEELEQVKPGDFSDATTDEVMPGVTVLVSTPDGDRTYHVLGEWDNAPELGVLSMKARLAANMLGKRPGDQFELPGAEDGKVTFGVVREIQPLPESIREWMKLPTGMQI